jgi:hypothetical protein
MEIISHTFTLHEKIQTREHTMVETYGEKINKNPTLASLILYYLKWNRAQAGHSQKQHQPATSKDLKSVLYNTISNKYSFF